MPQGKHISEERRLLDEVVRELSPTLERYGYRWVPGVEGTAHGPFATGHFVGPAGQIGLIWRLGSGLGGVSYGAREGFQCDHGDVMRSIGAQEDAWLVFDEEKWCPVSKREGKSLVEALRRDIETHTFKVLVGSPDTLREIAKDAYDRFMERLYSGASNRPIQPTTKGGG